MQHLDKPPVLEVEPSGRGGGRRPSGQPQAVHVRHRGQHQAILAGGGVQQLHLVLHQEGSREEGGEAQDFAG